MRFSAAAAKGYDDKSGSEQEDMSSSYFSNYPLYLKYTDIMDIMQVSKAKAYTMMNDLMQHPGIVFKQGKSIRVHRDRFFKYVEEKSGVVWKNTE